MIERHAVGNGRDRSLPDKSQIKNLFFLIGMDFEQKRFLMVEQQMKARGIKDKRVLQIMRKIPRHVFVPKNVCSRAYDDCALPIGFGQTISQPYVVASMTETLGVCGHESVLEIGTGSGYQTAVLAELVKEVFTIERIPDLSALATKMLERLGYQNVFCQTGDGAVGWKEKSPFDVIIVTAAPEHLPQELVSQVVVGGRIVIPVGPADSQKLLCLTRTKTGLSEQYLYPVSFVPLIQDPY